MDANTDWVNTTGPEAEWLHSLVDKTTVERGRQKEVGNGSPLTPCHEDAVNVQEMAAVAYLTGGQDYVVALIVGDEFVGRIVRKRMVQTKEDVVRALSAIRLRMEALGVRRVGLFGSFARGDQKPGSDVDLLVEFEPGRKTFDNFMQLAFLLEDLLQRRVEVVTPEALSPYIGPKILKEVEYVAANKAATLSSQMEDIIRRERSLDSL